MTSILATFAVDFQKTNHFEEELSLISAWNTVKARGHEMMLSCACNSEDGVCWPDDITFKINDQVIFDVPALLDRHQISRRKDRALIISPYIETFASVNPSYLQRIKLTFDIKEIK